MNINVDIRLNSEDFVKATPWVASSIVFIYAIKKGVINSNNIINFGKSIENLFVANNKVLA